MENRKIAWRLHNYPQKAEINLFERKYLKKLIFPFETNSAAAASPNCSYFGFLVQSTFTFRVFY